MNKDIKNILLIKTYCSKEFEALNVLEEAGILCSKQTYNNILSLARHRSRAFALTDEIYRQNYLNSLRIRRNYPQIRGIIKYVYAKHNCIPIRYVRIYRNANGERYIGINAFLNLFR